MSAPYTEDEDDLPIQPLATSNGGDGVEVELIFALADLSANALPDDAEAMLARVEEVADSHRVDPDTLLTCMEQPLLMAEVKRQARALRREGEYLRHRAGTVLEKMVNKAERFMDEDAINPAVLTRMMDVLFKLTGLAEERAARLRAAAGAATGPVLHFAMLQGDDPAPVVPEGALNLTIIAPNWTGGKKERVVSEQGGGHG